ncbi:hypothetical protein DSUL_140094 [Desulfovibrionales bacterium]
MLKVPVLALYFFCLMKIEAEVCEEFLSAMNLDRRSRSSKKVRFRPG